MAFSTLRESPSATTRPPLLTALTSVQYLTAPLMKSVLSLGQFVDFIFRQFYHVELPEFDMVKFDETITQAESKMIHINW